jgi:ring-1,2-phenylacetyl-CoA epoxidase subunit PaaC
MTKVEALFNYCLRLGDTSLILAQRLSEWTGHGPFLEEDLALTNIALDIFGRAKSLLEYAGKVEGKGRNEDQLAFFRTDREYFNTLIAEQPNGDYAKTILRQAFIDCFDLLFYTELTKSSDQTLAGIAQKSVKEIAYHKRHSFSWVNRFGNGTEESMQRLSDAFAELWQYTGEFFEMTETDSILIKEGIAVDLSKLRDSWEKDIKSLLHEAHLQIPPDAYMQKGGKQGYHGEHLGHLLAEMQSLPRAYPDAKW